jgi:DNA-binding NarL/FixJ family response regulator
MHPIAKDDTMTLRQKVAGLMGDRIRVLIVDDQVNVRKGLQALLQLERDLDIVGTATNGLEAIDRAEELKPDIILMDLDMPHLDGLEATRRIRDKRLTAKVIVLTTHIDPASQQQAKQAGADALVEKGAPDTKLMRIIELLHDERIRSGETMPFLL